MVEVDWLVAFENIKIYHSICYKVVTSPPFSSDNVCLLTYFFLKLKTHSQIDWNMKNQILVEYTCVRQGFHLSLLLSCLNHLGPSLNNLEVYCPSDSETCQLFVGLWRWWPPLRFDMGVMTRDDFSAYICTRSISNHFLYFYIRFMKYY